MCHTSAVLHISYNLAHILPACLHDSRLTCLIESVRSQSDQPGRQRLTLTSRGGKQILLDRRLLYFTQRVVKKTKVNTFISCSSSY